MSTALVVYITNALVAAGAFVLVALGKVEWPAAALFVAALLTPSAAHVALTRRQLDEDRPTRPTGLLVLLLVGSLAAGATTTACPTGASSPSVDAGAIGPVATGLCSLLEGIDDNGAIRTICATVEEIAQVIAFVLTLRTADDAGTTRARAECSTLPGTDFCATSPERAKAILFLVRTRSARFMLDAGR